MADTNIKATYKAIGIVKSNICMIDSLCTKQELTAVGGSFAHYLLQCLHTRLKEELRAKEKKESSEVIRPCIGCIYFNTCGITTRTEHCDGRLTKTGKVKEDS